MPAVHDALGSGEASEALLDIKDDELMGAMNEGEHHATTQSECVYKECKAIQEVCCQSIVCPCRTCAALIRCRAI
jgi:hypothetical protein